MLLHKVLLLSASSNMFLLRCSATFQLELQFVKLPGVARLVHRETILLCFRCSSAQCRLHFIFSRWFAFCSRPETYLGSLVVLLELRTSDFTTALPGTRSLTGAQAVRPRSLHRDAPAATRSVPSEARSYSYNPSGIVLLELRTSNFAKAPTDTTRSQTGPQAVRLQSLHRDAPAATRSLPSEALSYSYNPSGSASGVAHIGFGESPD